VATTLKFQYVWDLRYIDAPVCRDEDKNSDGDCTDVGTGAGADPDEHLYYTTDANMNVTALVERQSGTVVERYVYDPYGQVTIYNEDWTATITWANSKKNEILYCGYRFDPETELYLARHRYYHPTMGRWGTRDPAEYTDSASLYEYVRSSPCDAADASGLVRFFTAIHPFAFSSAPMENMRNARYTGITPGFGVSVDYEPNCADPESSTIKSVKIEDKARLDKALSSKTDFGGMESVDKGAAPVSWGTQAAITEWQAGTAGVVTDFGIAVKATVVYKWIPCPVLLAGSWVPSFCGIQVIGVEVVATVQGKIDVYHIVLTRNVPKPHGANSAGIAGPWIAQPPRGPIESQPLEGSSVPAYGGHVPCSCKRMPPDQIYGEYYRTSVVDTDGTKTHSFR
jgi:RHS repeat-associated protein